MADDLGVGMSTLNGRALHNNVPRGIFARQKSGGMRATFGLHFERGIIREQRRSGAHQFADVGGQGLKQLR